MIHRFRNENGTAFLFRPVMPEDLERTAALCDECVGKNLYSKAAIAEAIDADNSFFYLLETLDGNAVGYIYYYLTDTDSIAAAKVDPSLLRAVCRNPSGAVGRIQSVGIRQEYRKSGLAVKMLAFALEELMTVSAETVYIVCWKVGQIVPLERSLLECGFVFLTEAKRVWYEETELLCPHCSGRCECDAEVYYKNLN